MSKHSQEDDDWLELIMASMRVYQREYLLVCSTLAVAYGLVLGLYYFQCFCWASRRACNGNTWTQQQPANYQTCGSLTRFRVNHPKLTRNNAVYLSDIQCDRYAVGLLVHFAYGLLVYFCDPVNLFCLLVASGQVYEYCNASALNVCARSTLPLATFAAVSALLYAYSNSRLLLRQIQTNSILRRVRKRWQAPGTAQVAIQQSHIVRGHFLNLRGGDVIPADALLLTSTVPVLVDELQLTGEAICTTKSDMGCDFSDGDNKQGPSTSTDQELVVNHWASHGRLGTRVYSSKNILYAGTRLVDGNCWAVVIETGNDCKIYRSDRTLRKKTTAVQRTVTHVCLVNLCTMLFLAMCTSLVIHHKSADDAGGLSWSQFWPVLRKMILLFNTMIPLSLQFFFEMGSMVLSRRLARAQQVIVNRNGTMAFQSKPTWVVSDKTGTLTTNRMELDSIYDWNPPLYRPRCLFSRLSPTKSATESTDLARRVLSCTGLAVSSQGDILNNDSLEWNLVQELLIKRKQMLITNSFKERHGGGQVVWGGSLSTSTSTMSDPIQIQIQRLLYQGFDHRLGVKVAVTRSNQDAILHVQGTPEAVSRYSSGRGKHILQQLLAVHSPAPPPGAYQKTIAYGARRLSLDELESLANVDDVYGWSLRVLNELEDVAVYNFNDYLVEGVGQAVAKVMASQQGHAEGRGRKFTMLTGDKMESAIDTIRAMGLLSSSTQTEVKTDSAVELLGLYHIQDVDDVTRLLSSRSAGSPSTSSTLPPLLVNGQVLEKLSGSHDEAIRFVMLLERSPFHVVYRASPSDKQLYVALVQKLGVEVLMVGDGANDVPALLQANIGIGILGGESSRASSVCEIAVDSWIRIPGLLQEFAEKSLMVENEARWVIMKHMMTAFTNLPMLLMSAFVLMRDPAHPATMMLFNASMFVVMLTYCWRERLTLHQVETLRVNMSFGKLVVKGACLGLLDGMLVFASTSEEELAAAVHVLVALHALQLLLQIRQLKMPSIATTALEDRGWGLTCNAVHVVVGSGWLGWLLWNLSTIQYAWPVAGALCAFSWLVFGSTTL